MCHLRCNVLSSLLEVLDAIKCRLLGRSELTLVGQLRVAFIYGSKTVGLCAEGIRRRLRPSSGTSLAGFEVRRVLKR